MLGFTTLWECTDLVSNEPCKNSLNDLITFN